DLDDLLFEASRVLEQTDARTSCLMPFFSGDAGEGNEKEKGKPNRNLPGLNRSTQIQVSQCDVGPGPKHACQSRDDKSTFVVTEPDGEDNRGAIEKDQRHLVFSGQIEPADRE